MRKTLIIEGGSIHDIPSFYQEINRVFMKNEDWQIGNSLDAFNDLLYGGFGEIRSSEPVHLVWRDSRQAETALGLDATRSFYREKLEDPTRYNAAFASGKLQQLEDGTGDTYFEIILQIIADHPNIELELTDPRDRED